MKHSASPNVAVPDATRIEHSRAPPRRHRGADPFSLRRVANLRSREWRRFLRRAWTEFIDDSIPTVSAAVTFYLLLAFFPGLGAFVSLYGLFADVHVARENLASLRGLLPHDTLQFLGNEMLRVATAQSSRLGLAFLFGAAVSLWSANAGVKALINGLNVAYERRETRGFFSLTGLSLAITLSGVAIALGAFALAALPFFAEHATGHEFSLLEFVRWPALFAIGLAATSVLYRYAPDRRRVPWLHVLPGAIVAVTLGSLVSLAYSGYVAEFAHYDRIYGSLGALIGFLMWIWLSVTVLLFGAELNLEFDTELEK
jgi:membrane protein